MDLRSRTIPTTRMANKKNKNYGAATPRLELRNQINQQLVEDIDTDNEEQAARGSEQRDYSGQNSPSATQFITSSPKKSPSAQRDSIINQNNQGRPLKESTDQENVVEMMTMMMIQLNSISSRLDMLEQKRSVPETIVKVDVLAEKDSINKKTHAGKNMFNYSNDISHDDDDNGEGGDSDDDSYGSNSSYGSRNPRV